MNSTQGKVWGETRSLFCKNNVEVHRIEVNAGGFCSKHKHEHKYNAFYVESGRLRVTAWKNDYDLVDETTVRAGQITTCPPKEYHSFQALEDTVAYEIYWIELDEKDIVREDCGGSV
tara:strand:+ start:1766 stop:2116 length:351 start_codon:yes stop_codon:yes gene_type:complete